MRIGAPRFVLAACLFLCSGALGLGYELVWIHKASLIVGASQIALATVLTSFFLGLGLGSLVVGRYLRSRRWNPLFVYGLFEIGIGVFALLLPVLFRWLEALYGVLYPAFDGSVAALLLLRFLLLFVFFLPPTFFMGGTLPLLLDGLVARDRSVGMLTSFLYGLNIVGAVGGVLATSYFAIPLLGLNGTSLTAGFCNLAIGGMAIVAFRGLKPLHPGEPVSRTPLFFCAVSFVSGFAAIGYQVLWARHFSLFSPAHVHYTAVFLATYLAALAVGSMLLAPVLKGRIHPLRILVFLQPLVPVLALSCLGLWWVVRYSVRATGEFEVAARWKLWSENADTMFFAPLIAVASVLILPVILLGTGLPAIIAAATQRAGALRPTAGTLIFWNTLGSSSGGLVAGYALLPLLGLTAGFTALGVVSVCLAVAAQWKLSEGARPAWWRLLRPGYAPAAAALVVVVLWGRNDVTRDILLRASNVDGRLLAVEEGPLTTAYVFDGPRTRSLGAGSVLLATAFKDRLSPQVLQGYIPILFYPKEGWPEAVLGIAMGTGQTFGPFLRTPAERLDVVDISHEVVTLALAHFGRFNNGLADDRRVRFHFDDGRHFVARAPAESYDVVSLEPPPPTAEGVYRLYSLEFYQGVSRVLRDRGVLVQWLPPYLITPNDLLGMVKTQAEVFPHTFVIQSGPLDFVMLSVKGEAPPRLRPSWIEERVKLLEAEPGIRELRWAPESRYRVASLEGVLALLTTGPKDIAQMEAPYLHREDDLRLSYSSGDRHLLHRYLGHGLEQLTVAALPVTPFENLQQYIEGPIPVHDLEDDRAAALSAFGVVAPRRLAAAESDFLREMDPHHKAQKALAVAELYSRRHRVQDALDWIANAVAAHPTDDHPDSIESARRFAISRSSLYGDQIHAWLATLPEAHRAAPLVDAIAEELAASEERQARRLEGYLFP